MIREGKIGVQEAIALIVITISVKVYFTSPAYTARTIGTSSWIMTLISATTALFAFMLICKLLERFPGQNLIIAFELSLGRFFGFIASMLLILFFVFTTSIFVREFAEILKIYAFPLTPTGFVIGVYMIIIAFACYLGLEAISRSARLLVYYILAGFVIVIVLAYNQYDIHNLFPIFGYGIDKTVITGFSRSSFYGEVIILGLIAPSIQGISHIKKVGSISVIISGLIISAALFATMMAFNYATAQETASRVYELARVIRVGDFMQRLDPFFLLTWCLGSLIGGSILLYCLISSYCKAFRIQDQRPVILPFSIVLFTACMVPKDMTTIAEYVQLSRQYGWIVYFGLPIIVLMVAVLRKKKGVEKSA